MLSARMSRSGGLFAYEGVNRREHKFYGILGNLLFIVFGCSLWAVECMDMDMDCVLYLMARGLVKIG